MVLRGTELTLQDLSDGVVDVGAGSRSMLDLGPGGASVGVGWTYFHVDTSVIEWD